MSAAEESSVNYEAKMRRVAEAFLVDPAAIRDVMRVAGAAHSALDEVPPFINEMLAIASEYDLGAVTLEEARRDTRRALGVAGWRSAVFTMFRAVDITPSMHIVTLLTARRPTTTTRSEGRRQVLASARVRI